MKNHQTKAVIRLFSCWICNKRASLQFSIVTVTICAYECTYLILSIMTGKELEIEDKQTNKILGILISTDQLRQNQPPVEASD